MTYKETLEYLQGICSRREYCLSDLRGKAAARLDDPCRMEELMESLLREGYVDEKRYAAAFARDKSSLTGWGALKIGYVLRMKGIAAQDISAALGEIDRDKSLGRLHSQILAKSKTLQGDPQIKYKLIKFALSRGYDYPDVEEAVKQILAK